MKYNLMLKIVNSESVSRDELKTINEKYMYDYEFAKVLLSTAEVVESFKRNVVQAFLRKEIDGINEVNIMDFTRTILEGYHQISDNDLEKLFDKYHQEVMQPIRFAVQNTIDIKIPQHTINRLAKLELDVISNRRHEPVDYRSKMGCFAYVSEGPTLDYILENMPFSYGDAERIATSLINSVKISDEIKDRIFEEHGCDGEGLQKITPRIANELYMSAVETALPSNSGPVYIGELQNIQKAMGFIEHLIRQDMMTESTQLDLVERLIDKDKREKSRRQNHIIGLINRYTTSEKVLHKIFTSAVHANDRDEACNNTHVSEDDIREQAKQYCDKIRKKLKTGTKLDVSEKWIQRVSSTVEKATLYPEDYETILGIGVPSSIDAIVMSKKTPPNILKQAKELAESQIITSILKKWEFIKIKACVNEALEKRGFNDNVSLNIAGKLIVNLITHYNTRETLNFMHINTGLLKERPELLNELSGILCDAIDIADYNPEVKTKSDLKQEIKNVIEKRLNPKNISCGLESAKEMSDSKIINSMHGLKHDFYTALFLDTTDAYMKLQSMADKYAELNGELKIRGKSIEEER